LNDTVSKSVIVMVKRLYIITEENNGHKQKT